MKKSELLGGLITSLLDSEVEILEDMIKEYPEDAKDYLEAKEALIKTASRLQAKANKGTLKLKAIVDSSLVPDGLDGREEFILEQLDKILNKLN